MHKTLQQVVEYVVGKFQHVVWSPGYTVRAILENAGHAFSQKLSKKQDPRGRDGFRQLLDKFDVCYELNSYVEK